MVTAAGTTRGDAREQAILSAAFELLAVLGYERLTMDAVAERARASKNTIYRRWPNKAAMVVAAFAAMDPPPTSTELDTGSLRGDLLALLRAVRDRFTGANLSRMSSLMFAMQADPELAAELRGYFLPVRAQLTLSLLSRAAARGEVAATDSAPLHDLMVGLFLTRVLVTGEPVDDSYLAQIVDGVLIPLLTSPAPANTG